MNATSEESSASRTEDSLSSDLISSANRTIADLDQVIHSLHEPCYDDQVLRSPHEEHTDGMAGLSSGSVSVDTYGQGSEDSSRSAFQAYLAKSSGESFSEQIDNDDIGIEDQSEPISSVWESRWFDHAALVGRFMAEDRIQTDITALQYIPAPGITILSAVQTADNAIETAGNAAQTTGNTAQTTGNTAQTTGNTAQTTDNAHENTVTNTVSEDIQNASVSKDTVTETKDAVKVETVGNTRAIPQFGCKYRDCQDVFGTRYQRCYHYRAAHLEVQLQCPECCKVFMKLQQLEVHLRCHLKIKPYRCKYEGCNETFLTQQHCKNHGYTHTGERLFECNICKKAFREHGTLKRHTRTHSNVKLYKCEVCHKTFSYASSLNVHRKHFHPKLQAETAKDVKTSLQAEPTKEVEHKEISSKEDVEQTGKES